MLSGVALALAVSGCGSTAGSPGMADKLALQERFEERMAEADKALKQGQIDLGMSHLDRAIQADPAAKQPWLKKAQIHFDARQYGQAITEAQEVLQRDVRDLTAQSILAVSGLRVSAQALEQLRKANQVSGSTRSEAESVAKIIHEALGEPILMPTAAGAPSAQAVASRAPRSAAPRPRPASPAANAGTAVAGAPNTGVLPSVVPAVNGNSGGSSAMPKAVSAGSPVPSARTNPFGALQ